MPYDLALAIVLYNALKDKFTGVTPPITNGKNGNGPDIPENPFPTGHPCASMTVGSPAYISCLITYGQPNGNGNGPDIVGPEPVDPDEFDITTLPEYAGQVARGDPCPQYYTNVQVSGPYHVCKRSDLV